ncbi:proliferating cell nuclear antigen PcnA [Staphylothermus marinus F1]|uniref:DNA polymerase sliding clamp n=1 Tax=Staphylothermus marinus (strain ATCC 43588 / DSM 3639 / JCM 9404 / F1) TaxID=399550 RepID=A3DM84_STAMF|nr:DNA polymerase sliding clamp [Staphylothermus marinus]ABN69744.1 proliferating cell nuclear antigen PcnA [Staphylothermus marinus F1]
MRLRFADARAWRYAMNAIGKIIDEGAYKIQENGIRLRAIDPSRIVMVDFYIPREGLLEYEFDKEETIGVNMEDLTKILRRAVKGDELELRTLEAGRLAVIFLGRGTRMFIIPSLETIAEELPELKIPFTVKAKMLPSTFRDVVKELEPISDAIEFRAIKDEQKIIAKASGDIVEAEIELSIENGALIDFEASEDARAIYTIDYLSDISGASQAAEELTFEFATAVPCKIEYTLPQEGRLTFYVAPRVE